MELKLTWRHVVMVEKALEVKQKLDTTEGQVKLPGWDIELSWGRDGITIILND